MIVTFLTADQILDRLKRRKRRKLLKREICFGLVFSEDLVHGRLTLHAGAAHMVMRMGQR